METIGELLSRDLTHRIEEVIQVHQADEQSVYSEVSEYVATNSIRDQYATLLKAIAEAPAEQHESIGVWVSGFFGSGKSSFAKNLGYALKNPKVMGEDFARLFKRQLDDERIANLLDLINAKIPTEVILFEVAKEKDTRRVTERIAELMYAVVLRELGYAEELDIAELEIELEAEGQLTEFIGTLPDSPQAGLDDRPGGRSAGLPCQRHPAPPRPGDVPFGGFVVALPEPGAHHHGQQGRRTDLRTLADAAARARPWSSSSTRWASTSPAAATRSKTCVLPSRSSARSARIC